MDITFAILSITLGLVTSLAGGFWGVGCGWLIVPSLLLFPGEISLPVAAAASIMQLIPTSAYTVSKQVGKIGWDKGSWGRRIALPLCGFSFLGGFLGRPIGDFLESAAGSRFPHKLIYIILLAYILYTVIAGSGAKKNGVNGGQPKFKKVASIGFIEGILAAFLGIGGGTINRPIMRNVLLIPEEKTGQICRVGVFVTAISGSIGYCINNPALGQIVSIAGLISVGGMIGFPLGTKLHAKVLKAGNEHLADRSFAIIVGIVLTSMILKLLHLENVGQLLMASASVFLVAYLGIVTHLSNKKLRTLAYT